jgi:hypothetical protein
MPCSEIAYERQLDDRSSGGGDGKRSQIGRTATRHLHTGGGGGEGSGDRCLVGW